MNTFPRGVYRSLKYPKHLMTVFDFPISLFFFLLVISSSLSLFFLLIFQGSFVTIGKDRIFNSFLIFFSSTYFPILACLGSGRVRLVPGRGEERGQQEHRGQEARLRLPIQIGKITFTYFFACLLPCLIAIS